MAVGAAYFALGYFSLHALERDAPAISLAYIKVFVGWGVVVELQHDRVALAAVHTVVHL